ncbi:X-ray repair cross-complementing protein 5 [Sitodiplosis mosellana]|uniref:X-ray repair cross-complementing protein 5 n=1 Tax=Sitodiplosis mosellana TaxID=263140 RepID=UPI00244450ED|nr:X-ray repair cross-complementing protein 5 [Sitodiplosis mosellana]
MAATKDATIIILDVGANTNQLDKLKSKTFFEEAKSCIEFAITRKIFTRPKDEVSLFLFGTKTTDNELNKRYGSGYENINHAIPLSPMSWDILKYVQKSIDPPMDEGITGDWLDAVVVAMDYFNDLDLKKTTKKILLFTTFTTDVNDAENIDKVIGGLKHLEIELIVVTKNVIYEMDQDSEDQYANFSQAMGKDKVQEHSERLIKQIVMQSDGVLCSIDEAAAKLIYVDKKQRRRVPWKVDLTIGSNLAIKVSAFIYVRNDKELGDWKTRFVNKVPSTNEGPSDGDPSGSSSNVEISNVTMKTEHYLNDEVLDLETVAENLIKGYMYGGEPIPFEDDKYDNGGKGLKVIGFTDIDTVHDSHLVGDSIWAVVPQDGMTTSAKRFAAMLQAMHNKQLAIIARYTYREGTAPKMMALFPSENCLLMYELFFKDNYVDMRFPKLNAKKTTPSSEQLEAMGRFVDAMDLTKDNAKVNDGQPEPFKKLLDPGLQHMYRCIANRAINPSEPVLKVDDEILSLVRPPKRDTNVDELKALFPLEAAKLTGKEAFLQNMLKVEKQEADSADQLEKPKYYDVHEIGTVKPADDFIKLLELGEAFNLLAEQIQTVINNLVVKSIVAMDEKVLKALSAYRETAKQKAPFGYNEWIVQFKEVLKEREKVQLWQSLINENLGLITANESEMSTISEEEAQSFFKFDDFNTQHVQSNNNDIEDSNMDMFDEM